MPKSVIVLDFPIPTDVIVKKLIPFLSSWGKRKYHLVKDTDNKGREFKSINLSRIVFPYLSTPIDKPFFVSIFLSCSLPIKSWSHEVFELSLAIIMTVLTHVSCDHVTSSNYDNEKARNVGLTCRCHLSNIMPGSIFHENL